MSTATEARISSDKDTAAARQTADKIMHLLRDFIQKKCFTEAWDIVASTCYEQGYELTSKSMRKEYEAWKSIQLTMPMADASGEQTGTGSAYYTGKEPK